MKTTPFKLFFFASLIFLTNYYWGCGSHPDELRVNCRIVEPKYDEVIEIGTVKTIKINVTRESGYLGDIDSLVIYYVKDVDHIQSGLLTDPVKIWSPNVSIIEWYEYQWDTSDITPGTWYIVAVLYSYHNGIKGILDNVKIVLTINPPKVTTSEVTEITAYSATCGGTIVYNGPHEITNRGVVWSSENELPDLDDNEGETEDGSGSGTFTSHLTDLDKASYYVRAYAVNSDGVVYGDVKHFNTDRKLPAVKINDIGNVTAHTAFASGIITDDGNETGNITAGFVWSEKQGPTIDDNDGIYTVPEKLSKDMTFVAQLTSLKENTPYYIRAYASNSSGTTYGEEVSIETTRFSIQFGTFTDSRDEKQYRMVTIFGQTWMAENLAYLPEVCTHDENCGYWVYGYEGESIDDAKATDNYSVYGVLYSWDKAQTACPEGWHLPTSEEWSTLEMYLGMDYNTAHDVNNTNSRGDNEGGMLKKTGTKYWKSPNTGASNIAGFYALPGGYKIHNSVFTKLTETAYFWTNTKAGTSDCIIYRYLKYDSGNIFSFCDDHTNSNSGYSVRCVKD